MKTIVLSIVLYLSLLMNSINAQIYYVDTSGVDDVSRNGLSVDQAWASLAFATNQLSGSHDTIQFGVGDFYETATSYPKAGMVIKGIDTASTRVFADTSWTVSSSMIDETATDYMIYIDRQDNITILDIHFLSIDTSVMPNGAVYAFRSDSIKISHVFIENFRWAGLRYYINNYCEIAYSRFKNCSQYKETVWSGHVRTRYFNYSLIHHNIIESTWGFGYGYKASGHRGTKFYENFVDVLGSFSIESAHENEYEFEIYNNHLTGTLSLPKSGQQTDPTINGWEYSIWVHHNYLEDSYTVEGPRNHMIISHNHIDIKHPGGRVYTCFGGNNTGPVYIHNNVVEHVSRSLVWKNNGNIDSIHIFNNTIYADSTAIAGALVDLGPYNTGRSAYGWTFRNNIVVAPATQRRNFHWPSAQQAANLTAENNLFVHVDLVPEGGNNQIETYPDLTLNGPKPLEYFSPNCISGNTVDKGLDLGYPYLGVAPDIGAIEFDPLLASRLPYDTIIRTLPLTVEIEEYDTGGQGVAYNDDNIKEGDQFYRSNDNVDVCAINGANDIYALCGTEANEWVEYTIEITPGLYDLVLHRSAEGDKDGVIDVSIGGETLAIFSQLIDTDGSENFVRDTIKDRVISAMDCAYLRLSMTSDVGYLDKLEFIRKSDIPVYGINITNCPQVNLVQGLPYDFSYKTTPIDAANQQVLWTSSNEDSIIIDTAGIVDVLALTGSYTIYLTSLEGNFIDSCIVTLDRNRQTPYNFIPQYIPGLIEAEHYDEGGVNYAYFDAADVDQDCHKRNDDVDTQACQDINGGCNTGWSNAGEWLEYTTINTPGIYTIKARMATNNNTGSISISIGEKEKALIYTPNESNGWQDWKTAEVSGISIPGGKQVLRVYLEQGGFNLNWLKFEYEGPCENTNTNVNCVRSSTPSENDNIYIGPSGSLWNESPCNWSLGNLPTICDNVIIPAGKTVIISNVNIAYGFQLKIADGGTLVVEDGANIMIENP